MAFFKKETHYRLKFRDTEFDVNTTMLSDQIKEGVENVRKSISKFLTDVGVGEDKSFRKDYFRKGDDSEGKW